METIILSQGVSIRYKKFIEPKLSEKQKKAVKKLSQEIKKELLIRKTKKNGNKASH